MQLINWFVIYLIHSIHLPNMTLTDSPSTESNNNAPRKVTFSW